MRSSFTQKVTFFLFLVLINSSLSAQSIRDYSLEVSCSARIINSTKSVLDFKWPYRNPVPSSQRVYKKAKDILGWGSVYKVLQTTDSTFSDTITTGTHFEYKFEKDSGYDGWTVTGYVLAGSQLPAITRRGKILILVDSTNKTYLENDIRTYRNDLIGDGWLTDLVWLDSSDGVDDVKTVIVNRYNADTDNLKSVVLIGNLAVPYTGNYNSAGPFPPDGHTGAAPPSHEGAWSTDYYYACMENPFWPDSTITNTAGARSENKNVPFDGKFDYTGIADVNTLNTLQVGRIDMSDLPAFSETESELLRRYFDKNHRFRHRLDTLKERCLVDDNIGLLLNSYPYFDEHFAGNAYRNMAPLVSSNSTFNRDYMTTLDTASYLWSFNVGFGSYTNSSGVASTGGLANVNQEIKAVFNGFTGSYFGDWDNSDNLLKAVLAAKGNSLNSFFYGRPHYFFHHMGMGETIGYSVLRTQNNIDTITWSDYLYPTSSYSYLEVHVNMLGDPAVRMQPVNPPKAIRAYQDSCKKRVRIEWTKSDDTVVNNYYVFRAKHIDSSFILLGISSASLWIDSFPLDYNVYMIRGEKLQSSGSGSYFNLSQGLFDTVQLMQITAIADTSVCTKQTIRVGNIQNQQDRVVYSWFPTENNRDTFTKQISATESKVFIATDTIGGCSVRDTFSITALDLPVSETISSSYNACSDTVNWSASTNNGVGYIYNWTFPGGNRTDSSGPVLSNPGVIVYSTIGQFVTTLTVRNALTACENSDTQSITVICSSLPVNYTLINCVNTIKGKELRFIVYNNELFKSYKVQGNMNGEWLTITRISADNSNYYHFESKDFQRFSEIRVIGIKNDEKSVDLGNCYWTDVTSEWSVFPNPATDLVLISYNGTNGHQSSDIRILNALGIEVLHKTHVFNASDLEINLSKLPSGIYTIIIQTGDKIETFKLFKI